MALNYYYRLNYLLNYLLKSIFDKVNLLSISFMHPSLKPVYEQLLHSFPAVFPGIDRAVMLCSTAEGEIIGQELIRKGTNYRLRTLIIDTSGDFLANEKENSSYAWLHPNELPFDQKQKSPSSYHLFSEEQYLVLCLKLENKENGIDLFYLFFREDQSNFGISRLQGSLDTARKSLIGAIVLRMIRIFYQSANTYEKYISEFTDVTRGLLEDSSVNTTNSVSIEWTSDWVNDFLKTYPHQPSTKWIVPSDTVTKLSKAPDYNSAKAALTKAAQFASMLYAQDDEWSILPSFITFETTEKEGDKIKDIPPAGESRMAKAQRWLDNVEEATAKILMTGEEPTGSAVGQLLDRPVSAPAITDWLRQNQRRVMMLLKNHPSKWPHIRTHFRPLTNMVDRELKMRQTS